MDGTDQRCYSYRLLILEPLEVSIEKLHLVDLAGYEINRLKVLFSQHQTGEGFYYVVWWFLRLVEQKL